VRFISRPKLAGCSAIKDAVNKQQLSHVGPTPGLVVLPRNLSAGAEP